MNIVWDEPKRQANLDKNGFDFEDAVDFDWTSAKVEGSYRGVSRLSAGGADKPWF